jgi:hypothetical protein
MNIYHLLLAQPTDVTGIWPSSNPIIDVSSFPWRFERYTFPDLMKPWISLLVQNTSLL